MIHLRLNKYKKYDTSDVKQKQKYDASEVKQKQKI
jgi:hypothetical protein